jgi:hypothetical protein
MRGKRQHLTIDFMGDVMIGRLVDELIDREGYDYPWGDTLPLLKGSDLTIANLETTLTRAAHAVPKTFNFRAGPDKIRTLDEAGIDIVNLLASQWGRLFTNVGDLRGRVNLEEDDTLIYVGTENRNHMLGHMSMLGTKGQPVYPMCSGGPCEAALLTP